MALARFTQNCWEYQAKRKNICSACLNDIHKGDLVYKAEVEGRPNPKYESNEDCPAVIICRKCGDKMKQGKWITRA